MKISSVIILIVLVLAIGCDDDKTPNNNDGGNQNDASVADSRVPDDAADPTDSATGADASADAAADAMVDSGPSIDLTTLIADADHADLSAYCQAETSYRATIKPDNTTLNRLFCETLTVIDGTPPTTEQECEDDTDACVTLSEGMIPPEVDEAFTVNCDQLMNYQGTRTLGDLFECWDDYDAELLRVKSTLSCAAIVADPEGAVTQETESCAYLYADFMPR